MGIAAIFHFIGLVIKWNLDLLCLRLKRSSSLSFSVSSEALSRLDELHRNRYQSRCHSSSFSEADVHSDVDNSSVVSEPAYFPVSRSKIRMRDGVKNNIRVEGLFARIKK